MADLTIAFETLYKSAKDIKEIKEIKSSNPELDRFFKRINITDNLLKNKSKNSVSTYAYECTICHEHMENHMKVIRKYPHNFVRGLY